MTDPAAVTAVVPAAGVGRRFGSEQPKQYLCVAGRSVLEHSVGRLLTLPSLTRLILVVSSDDIRWRRIRLLDDPRVRVVTGGRDRAASVQAGLTAVAGEVDELGWLLVHDVARPCVPLADLSRLLTELADDPVGGLLAAPISDTVKRVAGGRAAATLERAGMWRAFTPQLFRYGLLRDAMAAALAAGIAITDEASAIEFAGHRPRVVTGSLRNIKITVPDDLELAAFYLHQDQLE